MRAVVSLVLLMLALAGCGSSAARRRLDHASPKGSSSTVPASSPAPSRGRSARPRRIAWRRLPEALVTAETENRLYAVDLHTGRVIARVGLPPDPEDVASGYYGVAVVSSARSGTVTVLEPFPKVRKILHGFGSPHIVAISPDGNYAFVTDDARGTVSAIELFNAKLVARVAVGAGAHHLAFSPDQRRLWIALGESARTIVVLDTSDVARPRVIDRFDPGFPVHDLLFSPNGRQVWLTSAAGSDVVVLNARTRRVLFRVPAGKPPQHVVFSGSDAFITSGYGGSIEKVAAGDGRVLRRVRSPYGSFELDAGYGYVVTSSLFDGTLAVYTAALRLMRLVHLAPVTRDVALSVRFAR